MTVRVHTASPDRAKFLPIFLPRWGIFAFLRNFCSFYQDQLQISLSRNLMQSRHWPKYSHLSIGEAELSDCWSANQNKFKFVKNLPYFCLDYYLHFDSHTMDKTMRHIWWHNTFLYVDAWLFPFLLNSFVGKDSLFLGCGLRKLNILRGKFRPDQR